MKIIWSEIDHARGYRESNSFDSPCSSDLWVNPHPLKIGSQALSQGVLISVDTDGCRH